jgi:hypothetical protein
MAVVVVVVVLMVVLVAGTIQPLIVPRGREELSKAPPRLHARTWT